MDFASKGLFARAQTGPPYVQCSTSSEAPRARRRPKTRAHAHAHTDDAACREGGSHERGPGATTVPRPGGLEAKHTSIHRRSFPGASYMYVLYSCTVPVPVLYIEFILLVDLHTYGTVYTPISH